jgi:hypothetical protein
VERIHLDNGGQVLVDELTKLILRYNRAPPEFSAYFAAPGG